MKKMTKICLIVCLVFFLAGMTLIGSSMVLGLNSEQLFDLAHYFKHLDPRMENGELRYDLPTGKQPDSGEQTLPETGRTEETGKYFGITDIDIELAVCELHVQTHGEDFLALDVQDDSGTFKARAENGTLYLENGGETHLSNHLLNTANIKLDLYLPAGELDTFTLELGAGDVEIDELAARDTDCDIGAGNLTIGWFGGSKLDIDCGTGNIDLCLDGRETDYNYDLDCGIGSAPNLSPSQQENRPFPFLSGQTKIDHGASRDINIDCGIGDVAINFTEEK